MNAAVSVEHITKTYMLGSISRSTFRDEAIYVIAKLLRKDPADYLARIGSEREKKRFFNALDDVSFEVAPGEVAGLVGGNGAGKSTMLKILARITEPTSGRAVIRGRASTLLEVGAGFHPELTGRQNVFMNGAILGMKRREIETKFDEIVAFSGIEKFIDTPVKRYSSGMYVRLAFAVAAHLDAEVLFVDEVLAVGDLEFQNKCLRKMGQVAKSGRTVVFVSHDISAMRALCDKCYWFEKGSIIRSGATNKLLDEYEAASRIEA